MARIIYMIHCAIPIIDIIVVRIVYVTVPIIICVILVPITARFSFAIVYIKI